MGGTIGATSEPGSGSNFWFEIPFHQPTAEVAAAAPLGDLIGLRVLVADGNSTNRRVFESYVESWGMRTAAAADATDALARLHRAASGGDAFHIALLDYGLPGANGVELAHEIASAPALHRTRVILLTASGQVPPEDPSGSVNGRVVKPVRQSRLLDTIASVMSVSLADSVPGVAGERREQVADANGSPTAPPSGYRILVAEDQSVNWKLVDRLLEKRGHEAVNAADGESALKRLESEHYDLVLMDCQMPLLDGYETTRELRRREAAQNRSRVPIVAMTASAMQGDRERCLEAGMDDYLAKPITAERLDELLDRWLPVRVASGAATPKS
jgi:CheY-like chemotaxis protein